MSTKRFWFNLRYYPRIYPERLKKITKTLISITNAPADIRDVISRISTSGNLLGVEACRESSRHVDLDIRWR
jgi:hypothetical protein